MELDPPVIPADATPPIPDMAAFNAQLLHQIVEQAPRLLKEGLFLAAIPYGYNVALLTALRQREDEKDARLVERLAEYSFITSLTNAPSGMSHAVHSGERELLQAQWLKEDAGAYRTAHERALTFWRETPPATTDPFIPTQNIVYHELIAAPEAGIETLITAFRDYSTARRLAAIDRLLVTVEEADQRLDELNDPIHPRLLDTLAYLRARLDQLRGNWQRAKLALDPLVQRQTSARLHPFVLRAYGLSLVQMGQYVEAMDYLEQGLKALKQRDEGKEELGFTMLALGDANVQLAAAARGYFADPQPPQTPVESAQRYLPLLPIPLMIYLSLRGLNFWHPDSWPAMKSQDWIIARLFGRGAKWYRAADKLLESDSRRSVWGQADEKLAWLYLNMGDARQALPRFQGLLTDTHIEEFQRASSQLGLAESYWQLGRVEEAERLANEALPLVEAYEATDLSALGEELLGKIAARKADYATAITRFGRALRFYQRNGDLVNATAMAEEMERLATYPEASLRATAQDALNTANVILPIRRYPARFQHQLLQYFQWGMVVIGLLLLFLMPMLAIRVQQGSFLQYSIGFETQPPLQAGTGIIPLAAEPSFDAGIIPNVVPDTALNVVFWLVLFLLVLYTLVGIYLIVQTRFSSVQAATQAQTLAVSATGITSGDEEPLKWQEISHVLQAETTFNANPIPIASTTVFTDGQRRIYLKGSTAFYEPLRTRLLQRIPATVKPQQLNSAVFPSRMAVLYLICLGLILLLAFASTQRVLAVALSRDLSPLPYSILDLYPFLYLGLVIPPVWWIAVQPLRVLATLRDHWRAAGLVVGGILLTLVIRESLWFRTWFLQPNLFAYVAAGLMGGALVVAVIRAWRLALPGDVDRKPILTASGKPLVIGDSRAKLIDGALALFAVAVVLFSAWSAVRTLVSYHLVQEGDVALLEYDTRTRCSSSTTLNLNDDPDDITAQKEECPDDPRLLEAVAKYESALDWQPDNSLAVRGLGAAHIQRQEFELALEDFTRLIQLDPTNGYYYADRAVAYAVRSRFALLQGEEVDSGRYHGFAIVDFDNAIEAEPYTSEFYLWRGSAYHAINLFDNARADYTTAHKLSRGDPRPLTNLGWLAFQQGQFFKTEADQTPNDPETPELREAAFTEFDNARAFFQQAIANSPFPSADLHFALGYSHYELGESLQQRLNQWEGDERAAALERMIGHYQEALDEWDDGVRLAPDSATGYNLRATAYWRMGTLYPNGTRGDICADGNVPTSLKAEKETRLLQALADYVSAGELNPTDDFNFRTQGQIHFLLRSCPGQDAEDQLKLSIENYTQALTINPDAVPYLQFRPRITFSLYVGSFQNRPERVVEFHPYALTACNDYQRLLALAPDNAGNAAVEQRVLPMTQAQADGEIAARRYDLAYQTYRCLLTIIPSTTNYFNAGLTALAQGDGAQAQEWYNAGMAQAEADQDSAALDMALAGIAALSQVQPTLPESTIAIFDALTTLRQMIGS
jgi:tetratricopeptide (TPR) repeat protein